MKENIGKRAPLSRHVLISDAFGCPSTILMRFAKHRMPRRTLVALVSQNMPAIAHAHRPHLRRMRKYFLHASAPHLSVTRRHQRLADEATAKNKGYGANMLPAASFAFLAWQRKRVANVA